MQPKIIPSGAGERRNVIGDNQIVKISAHDTGGAFALFEQLNQPGVGVPLHVHQNEHEIFYILEGQVAFTIGEESLVAGAGSTVLLPLGVPHAFIGTGDAPFKTLAMIFPANLDEMFQELSELPTGPPNMAKVLEICLRYGITFLASPAAPDDLAAV